MARYKLNQLYDERATLTRDAKAVLARVADAEANHRPADADQAEYERLESLLTANKRELEAEHLRLEAEAGGTPEPHPDRLAAEAAMPLVGREMMERGWAEEWLPGAQGRLPSPKRYAALFGPARDTRGFRSFREFATVLWHRQHDPRLQAISGGEAGNETIPSEGGFFVPEQYAAQLLDRALESEIVRPRADVQPMTTLTKKVSDFDRMDTSSGAPAGFAAQWLGEGDTATPVVPKVRQIALEAKRLALYVNCTSELLSDAPQFDALLGAAMPEAVGWHLDNAFLTGTGAGQPLGVLNDPSLITVTKESGQAAATIMYENLIKMFASLHPSLVNEAVWVASPTTIPQLLRLVVVIKNVAGAENVGGSFVPVISERNGQFTILTRPVIFTEKVPVLGTKGDILLAAFSQYVVGLRKEVSLDRSIHVKWLEYEDAWRCVLRADGQSKWGKPMKNRQGTSLSWAVALETR